VSFRLFFVIQVVPSFIGSGLSGAWLMFGLMLGELLDFVVF